MACVPRKKLACRPVFARLRAHPGKLDTGFLTGGVPFGILAACLQKGGATFQKGMAHFVMVMAHFVVVMAHFVMVIAHFVMVIAHFVVVMAHFVVVIAHFVVVIAHFMKVGASLALFTGQTESFALQSPVLRPH